ncbi:PTS sugar transporter subunit IIA [Planctomycetota bacterium]
MKFSDFVCFDAIVPELQAGDRDAVITELVDALEKAGRLQDGKAKQIARAIIKRESEASTGIGKGVAVPHVKHSAVKDVIATVGISHAGVDFSSLDKMPVYSVILLISPTKDPDKHLGAMEKIFKYLQQDKFRRWLGQSRTAAQVQELLKDSDEKQVL